MIEIKIKNHVEYHKVSSLPVIKKKIVFLAAAILSSIKSSEGTCQSSIVFSSQKTLCYSSA